MAVPWKPDEVLSRHVELSAPAVLAGGQRHGKRPLKIDPAIRIREARPDVRRAAARA